MKRIALILLAIQIILFLTGSEMKTEKTDLNFQAKSITQIGMVVRDIEKSSEQYAEIFGMKVPDIIITDKYEKANTHFKGKPTNARAKLAFFHFENITIELIEPIDSPSTWEETLKERGDGFHHIAMDVEKIEESIDYLENKGGKLLQKGDFTGGSYAYVDMESNLGMIIELLSNSE